MSQIVLSAGKQFPIYGVMVEREVVGSYFLVADIIEDESLHLIYA